jgi:hypothetical protein
VQWRRHSDCVACRPTLPDDERRRGLGGRHGLQLRTAWLLASSSPYSSSSHVTDRNHGIDRSWTPMDGTRRQVSSSGLNRSVGRSNAGTSKAQVYTLQRDRLSSLRSLTGGTHGRASGWAHLSVHFAIMVKSCRLNPGDMTHESTHYCYYHHQSSSWLLSSSKPSS